VTGDRRMHLAWFLGHGFGVNDWTSPWKGTGGQDWMRPEFAQDFARALERACFDYLIIEDSSFVCDAFGGSAEAYLKNAMSVPKHDPAVLASVMLLATRRIGIVPTLTVTEYPPFLLARLVATLDNLSEGRAGWNVVTGSSDRAAQNYGKPTQPLHDLRYDMAQEYTDLVKQLWASWEPDAIAVDAVAGVFADHTKVHPIDFQGTYFSSRGPLNTAPSPQGRPALIQAGGSPRGREFAARNADSIIASVNSPEEMKAYRDDVRARAESAGRDPDEVKVLFLISPYLGETTAEARDRKARHDEQVWNHPELGLAGLGFITDIDFSGYDVDTPLEQLNRTFSTNGHQSSLAQRLGQGGGTTLRQIAAQPHAFEPVGTPEEVAEEIGKVMEEVGGDGLLLNLRPLNRRIVAEITDGLVPELQARGLSRTGYDYPHLRDNLRSF
jgi:FMN-dependent oxidoreductase (nitrilotriacetate monooxygenase family)